MSKKTFKLFRGAMAAAVAVLIALAIQTGNVIMPLVAVGVAMGLLYLGKKRVKEVTEDERIYRISEKASRKAVSVIAPLMAVAGAVLLALSKSLYPQFEQAGLALAYSVCALMVCYYIFYVYYEKKY